MAAKPSRPFLRKHIVTLRHYDSLRRQIMYFQRLYLDCLAHASYLVADEETKIAAVIDPQRDVDVYLQDAAEHGFVIQHVILTHFPPAFAAGPTWTPPGAGGVLDVRKAPQQRAVQHNRRTAALQLRPTADGAGGIQTHDHGRPARGARLLRPRRAPQSSGSPVARRIDA